MTNHRAVYIIDHDLGARRFLTTRLAATGAEAWPFADGAEFLEIVDHLMPATILLDMDLEAPGGLELMASLAARNRLWPVVAISARHDVPLAVDAMKLGAVDFLLKPLDAARLSAALARAAELLLKLVETSDARRLAQEKVAHLTAREIDVFLALSSGRSNKAVAYEFGISVRTVEMHRAHILAKLGTRNLAEAAVLAGQAGLPDAADRNPAKGRRAVLRMVPGDARDTAPAVPPHRFALRSTYS